MPPSRVGRLTSHGLPANENQAEAAVELLSIPRQSLDRLGATSKDRLQTT